LGFLGVGLIFAGSALNLFINTLLGFGAYFEHREAGVAGKKAAIPWMLVWQTVLAFILALGTLGLLYYNYRHGEMPTFLRPPQTTSGMQL